MIELEELYSKPKVRNLHYKTIEEVVDLCKMKDSQRGWCMGVLYRGPDRNNDNIPTLFCKCIDDFCKEFELC